LNSTDLRMISAKIPPAVNQIEAHPYLQQRDLLEWSKEKVRAPIMLRILLLSKADILH